MKRGVHSRRRSWSLPVADCAATAVFRITFWKWLGARWFSLAGADSRTLSIVSSSRSISGDGMAVSTGHEFGGTNARWSYWRPLRNVRFRAMRTESRTAMRGRSFIRRWSRLRLSVRMRSWWGYCPHQGFVDVPLPLADCRAHRGPMSKSLTAGSVQAMQNPETPDETLCGALSVAWLSGDADLIPDVRSVLDRVEPESKAALHACIALQGLGDTSPEFARSAEGLAFTREYRREGLNALIGLGAVGVEGLKRWLREAGEADRLNEGGFVIRALHAMEEGRDDAIEAAADLCRRNRMFLRPLYEIAAESSDRSVRENVLEAAFTESAAVVQAPLDAIRGLAKFDAARAAEAVEAGFSKSPENREGAVPASGSVGVGEGCREAHWCRDRGGAGVAFRCSWPGIAVGERVDCRGSNSQMLRWNGSGEIDWLQDCGMAAVSDGGGGP